MSTAMAESCVLCCLVDSEDEVFKVRIKTSDDIMDLKARIHEVGVNMAYQVRSKRLTLWKVSAIVYVDVHAAHSIG
jgi:hypothetical protein